LGEAKLDFGVFGPPKFDKPPAENGHSVQVEEEAAGDGEVERQSRPVIKLRPGRYTAVRRSRSRSNLDSPTDEPMSPESDSIANVRFSAQIVAKMDLSDLLPFALIAPEQTKKKAVEFSRTSSLSEPGTAVDSVTASGESTPSSPTNGNEPLSPIGRPSKTAPFLQGPPADLKGVFLRKFRWGTVDVLDPNHCDFAALRTAVLSTHMKVNGSIHDEIEGKLKVFRCSKSGRKKCCTKSTAPKSC
jgi:hypothetical protein